MLVRRKLLGSTLWITAGFAAMPSARAQSSEQVTIDGARKVLNDLRHDQAFGNARQLLPRARAAMIVPRLYKGGFFVGGEGGNGVLMAHHNGRWSDPAFFAIGAASFGFQIGLEKAELIMLVMSDRALQGVLRNNFKIGAQAGLSVATIGGGAEAATSGPTLPDIVVWSSSTGLYGGLTVDGSVIRAEPHADATFYGRPVNTEQILAGEVSSPGAVALRQQMEALG